MVSTLFAQHATASGLPVSKSRRASFSECMDRGYIAKGRSIKKSLGSPTIYTCDRMF